MSQTLTVNLETWRPASAPPDDDPQAVVDWAVDRFDQRSMAMTTSFGMEGVALLNMIARRVPDVRVIYVDTDFLFEETHRLRRQLETLYSHVRFEAARPLLTPDDQAARYGRELWKSNPDFCCRMRKVEPLYRTIVGVDVWFAALRRTQSCTRANIQIVDWDWQYQLIKICPLSTWSRQQVYEYVVANNLPYNELHDKGYPSVGCTHCTRPVTGVQPWEYSRDGRWNGNGNGNGKTECGMHGAGI